MTPEQRIASAVRDAQFVLTAYKGPGLRDPEKTISELFNVLGDYHLIEALETFENAQRQKDEPAGSKQSQPARGPRGEVLDQAPWS